MMRRGARRRGRGIAVSARNRAPVPAGFGNVSSSSSSDDENGGAGTPIPEAPAHPPSGSAAKRPRRIFRPSDTSDPFLNHLKQRKQDPVTVAEVEPLLDFAHAPKKGSFDPGDPSTTNVFVRNLHPSTDEARLQDVFGRYGPVGSVKIMWPRSAEEYGRGYNSGFVSFMDRDDAEAAFQALHETKIDGHVIRLVWGKAMRRVAAPLKPLPGQVYGGSESKAPYEPDELLTRGDSSLPRILVQPPLNLCIRREVHKLARETLAMRVAEDSEQLASHDARVAAYLQSLDADDAAYYDWRLHSLSSGDSETRWRTAPLALVRGGPVWDPPPCARPLNNPPRISPKKAVAPARAVADTPALPEAAAVELERLLDSLQPTRASVALGMVFCLDHSRCAGEVSERLWGRIGGLARARASAETGLGLVYLAADVLHNSAHAGVVGGSAYRTCFATGVEAGFAALGEWRAALPGRMAAHTVAGGIAAVLDAWAESRVFPEDVLGRLRVAAIAGFDRGALAGCVD